MLTNLFEYYDEMQRMTSCLKTRARGINPLKPNFSNSYIMPYRSDLPFLISNIRALQTLRAERQSARMSEIKNGRSDLYVAEHSKCNHTMTLGSLGLTAFSCVAIIYKVINGFQ